jgi:hypothetical protein
MYADNRDVRRKHGIAIINPYGGIWTDEIFDTPEAAAECLKQFWKEAPMDLSKFKLAMATATITLDRVPGDPILIPVPM